MGIKVIEVEPSKKSPEKPSAFFVTCIGRPTDKRRVRCWGWFTKLEEAREAVLANSTDMFEDGYYTFAVIEELPEGLVPIPVEHGWFSYDPKTRVVTTCSKPAWSEGKLESRMTSKVIGYYPTLEDVARRLSNLFDQRREALGDKASSWLKTMEIEVTLNHRIRFYNSHHGALYCFKDEAEGYARWLEKIWASDEHELLSRLGTNEDLSLWTFRRHVYETDPGLYEKYLRMRNRQ